jgi:Glycosyl hydrolase family 115
MTLYKEVLRYYEDGLKIPDDVTLIFPDDNYGNIRRLPNMEDRSRRGGSGVSGSQG